MAQPRPAAGTTKVGRTSTTGRHDSTAESSRWPVSRKPHSHPNQHTEEDMTLIRNMRRRPPTWSSWSSGQGCEAVPVHRHRRILALSNPGSISGTEHLFICRFSSQSGRFICPQMREGRSNSRPMRPLAWLSPRQRLSPFSVQDL